MSQKHTINGLSVETGIDRRTVAKILQTTKPIDPGFFLMADFIKALREYDTPDNSGSYRAERLRKTTEEADAIALENAKTRGELLDLEDWCKSKEPHLLAMKQIVEDSGLPEDKQDEVLTLMAKVFEP